MPQKHAVEIVGIDVSKEFWDAAQAGRKPVRRFAADASGLRSLLTWLGSLRPQLICLEATGGFEATLVDAFEQQGLTYAVVNPRQVRDFARAMNQLAKTDAIDARVIAQFAAKMNPQPSQKPGKNQQKLQALQTRRQQVVDMLTQEKNRLSSQRDPHIRRLIQKAIEMYERQLRAIEKEIQELMQGDAEMRRKMELLCSTVGIAETTAGALLAEMPELGTLNRGQADRLAGLAPLNRDSGKLRGKRTIRGGRAGVRRALYMATLVATQHNPKIRRFYQHLLGQGKKKLVALTACMRKLLLILNAMLKNNTAWNSHANTS